MPFSLLKYNLSLSIFFSVSEKEGSRLGAFLINLLKECQYISMKLNKIKYMLHVRSQLSAETENFNALSSIYSQALLLFKKSAAFYFVFRKILS